MGSWLSLKVLWCMGRRDRPARDRPSPRLARGGVGGDVGVVGANAEDGQIDLAYLFEPFVIRGVAAVEHAFAVTLRSGRR
jgi:hypothetical protein